MCLRRTSHGTLWDRVAMCRLCRSYSQLVIAVSYVADVEIAWGGCGSSRAWEYSTSRKGRTLWVRIAHIQESGKHLRFFFFLLYFFILLWKLVFVYVRISYLITAVAIDVSAAAFLMSHGELYHCEQPMVFCGVQNRQFGFVKFFCRNASSHRLGSLNC